ncbi:MAG: glycosyltransferase family 2 protein, partial [Burkholderiales bacterium]
WGGLSPYSRLLRGWRTRHFRAWAWRYWRSTRPVRVVALSGGHVLLRRSAVEAAGGLFDERFFMYWEDSDLMQRLHHVGYRLQMIPAARAVHEYTHSPHKGRLLGEGWPRYFEKHLKPSRWVRWIKRLWPANVPSVSAHWPLADVDPETGDLRLPVPAAWRGGWLLELSPNPDFIPAMGQVGQGETVRVAAALHRRFGGEFYIRLGPQKAWSLRMQCWRFLNQAQ